jgi:hypothetical protein
MRSRSIVLVAVAVAAMIATVALSEKKKSGLLLLEWANRGSKERPPAAVLIEMGMKDREPAQWSGRAVVTGAKVVEREGYRFRPDDKLSEPDRWETSSHWGLRVPPRNPAVRMMEGIATVGVVLHLSDIQEDASLTITTAHEGAEKAEMKLKDVLAGHAQGLWGGKARVRLISTASLLTSGKTEDDFPAAAYGPDGTLWVAYISYKVRDESCRIEQPNLKQQPSDFKSLYTPEFADQLFVKSFRDDKWSEPLAITGPKEDLMRCAIAVEGNGIPWVVYSANRKGRYDLFTRSISKKVGEEEKLTGHMRDDGVFYLNPVMNTDRLGRILVASQYWSKEGFGGIFSVENLTLVNGEASSSSWSSVTKGPQGVEESGANWNAAIATGPNEELWQIAYDNYRKGDYDVLLTLGGKIDGNGKIVTSLDKDAIASSSRFEARPSICYDAKGRLWIAYEEGPEKWGKDSGALAKTGDPLYSKRSVRVVCLDTDGKLKKPAAELPTSNVENPGAQLDANTVHRNESGTRYSSPRIGLDGKGRLWLTYRQGFGSRYTSHPGNCWLTFARRLDGDHWTEPIEVHHSDGLLDSRPVVLPHASGGVLIVHNTDGRWTTPNDVQNRIYTSYLDLPGEPVEPKLVPHDPGSKDATAGDKEAEDVKRIRAYRIEAGGKKYQLLRGEFHRHTEISWDGGADGSLEDMFRYAIDAAALDWIGNGDHDNGAGREYTWWLTQKLTDAYHIKDRFAPLFCYERSVSYPHGHRNCLFVQRGVRTLPRLAEPDPKKRIAGIHADDTKMLYRYLKEFDGICAAHTSATGMGTDWRDNDRQVEPIVEIYQGDRNAYEMEEAPRAGYDPKSGKQPAALGGWKPDGYINHALAKGYRLGFESSSDHWSTHISYCVAVAEKHDRAGILTALKQRHCYGATDNIILNVRCGDHLMGDEFKTNEAPVLNIHVIGTAPLAGIDVLKDSTVVETLRPADAKGSEYKDKWEDPRPQAGVHYYYVRVRQKDGQLAWASPMWIEYAK